MRFTYMGLKPDPRVSTGLIANAGKRPTLAGSTQVILGHADIQSAQVVVNREVVLLLAVVESADDDLGVSEETSDGPLHWFGADIFLVAAVDVIIIHGMNLKKK